VSRAPDDVRPASAAARDETRARLLAAAARVYAQHGYQGATTRAIAAEAGVNEVTLFRLFGAKEALLDEAIATEAECLSTRPLPRAPVDPRRELAAWCGGELARMQGARGLIRNCFAESDEHPSHVRHAVAGLESAAGELRRYVARLGGRVTAPERRDAAVGMLLSALIADAVGRDEMPGVFRMPERDAAERYADVFLGALGVEAGADGGGGAA